MTSIPAQSTSDDQSQSKLVPPHGSETLKPLLLKDSAREEALKLAEKQLIAVNRAWEEINAGRA